MTNCPRKRQQEEALRAASAEVPTESEMAPAMAPAAAPETAPVAPPKAGSSNSGESMSAVTEMGSDQKDKRRHASGSDDEQPVRKKEPTVIPETQAETPMSTPEEDAPKEDLLSPLVIDATE